MDAWETFLADIDKAKKKLGYPDVPHEDECLYRGSNNSEHDLLPSLLYNAKDQGLSDAKLREVENSLFFEFRMRATGLAGSLSQNSWDVLFLMRHHMMPTRILDWTENLGTAVFFAIKGAKDDCIPCVWVLNPYELNKKEDAWDDEDFVAPEYITEYSDGLEYSHILTSGEDFVWELPIAVYPTHSNPRLRAQSGYFTMHGSSREPLNKLANDCVIKVLLPHAAHKGAAAFLEKAGINSSTLFPDLDGLSEYLRAKYGMK